MTDSIEALPQPYPSTVLGIEQNPSLAGVEIGYPTFREGLSPYEIGAGMAIDSISGALDKVRGFVNDRRKKIIGGGMAIIASSGLIVPSAGAGSEESALATTRTTGLTAKGTTPQSPGARLILPDRIDGPANASVSPERTTSVNGLTLIKSRGPDPVKASELVLKCGYFRNQSDRYDVQVIGGRVKNLDPFDYTDSYSHSTAGVAFIEATKNTKMPPTINYVGTKWFPTYVVFGGYEVNYRTRYNWAATYNYGANVQGLKNWKGKVRVKSWPKMPRYRGGLGEAPNMSLSVFTVDVPCTP